MTRRPRRSCRTARRRRRRRARPQPSPRRSSSGDHRRKSSAANREKLPSAARATPRRPSSAATRSICAPANTTTAARRDLHRHAQGRRRLPRDDEQLRHRHLARPAIRRAAGGICRGLHLHPLRAGRHGAGQRRDQERHLDPRLHLPRTGRQLSRPHRSGPCKPQGATFDDLGGGSDEVSNLSEVSEKGASKSLEVLKQISSTGYLRKRLPQELVVLARRHGATALAGAFDPISVLNTLVPETMQTGRHRRGDRAVDWHCDDGRAHQGQDAGLRGRPVRRMRQLHAGAQRHLHEVQHLRRNERV
jgi:hypothetical protein